MLYVHYWHFQRAWYARITESPVAEPIYWHNDKLYQNYWDEEYLVKESKWITHRQVKQKLQELYPNCILVKDKPFHEGRRWSGYKQGSRK